MIALSVILAGHCVVNASLAKGLRLFRSVEDVGETSPHVSGRRTHFPQLSDAEKAALALGFASTVGDALYLTRAGDGLIGFAPGVGTGTPVGRAIEGWRSSLDRLFGDDTAGPSGTQRKKTLVIDSSSATLLRDDIRALADAYRLKIYDSRYGLHPIKLLEVGGGRSPFVELRSGLLIPLEDALLPDDVVAVFEEQVNSADIRVTSLLTPHDGDALRRLLEELGDRLIPLESTNDGSIPEKLLGGKINVLIGHVANDAFAWETSTGVTRTVNFSDIKRQAAEAHTAVLLVGCESFAGAAKVVFYLRRATRRSLVA